jgi:diguanylate cyclase (GGDEF)-like protein
VTAPSLSVPSGALAGVWQQARAYVPLPVALGAAAGFAGTFVAHWLGGAAGVDPVVALLVVVAAAAAYAGLRAGAVAAAISLAYVLLVAPPATEPGLGRTVVAAAVLVAAAGVAGRQGDRLRRLLHGLGDGHDLARRMTAFNAGLAEARPAELPDVLVERAAALVDADLVALTVCDPRTGRHHVRAVLGTSPEAIGVEVLPGVGIAGQSIREHRTVVVGRPTGGTSQWEPIVARLSAALGRTVPPAAPSDAGTAARRSAPAMAVPAIDGGIVVATLTVGRASRNRPFTSDEQALLELAAPQIGMAVAGGTLRAQLREASLIDAVTGLYNRPYLDAALGQLLALRRRTPAEEREPLSLILFDIDGFGRLNEEHGDVVGDRVLRAVAALVRQRFRASDTVARVGGDGLFVVMDGADTNDALAAAGEVRAQVRELAVPDERGTPLSVSVSAGVALFRDEAVRSEAIIRTVEAALDTARWSSPGSIVAV